ncbi:condensin subunit ScpA [Desulfitobacterium sp. LBE]|uniref:Segregation and condensation protein A n=5 Tax=root TaxID=1 RepID=SCPA_DESHY|nr:MULTISPECIES: segregation/condensation protein A [Desulfitobacterium]B8FPL1.1 RecName: Full=Segregation and condensation protein A [Desulfitobacterium hafniense DCB-2]Q24V65.1 RecName: Full=Segregation and condensation protein A [Desulfitobacterium hafniense Y51]ACL21443.1 chromosome segregation and condensation protein ScpA [Desulfitobacterium hafniense DCB-2]EHL07423.1 ScpA/B protein [Desulfitobacterium hafniense DP7]KTE89881.1 rifampin ADP-ribosyl transferase [Desulfitobacterium hafniens
MSNGSSVSHSANTAPYVELPAFQGPMDLLLHLIQQEKVDIYDIPIARITDQFIQVVRQMEDLDMEVTTEFLVLAAQLLQIKSRYLLPKPVKDVTVEEEGDPRQELVERLLAYRAFKQAAETLGEIQISSGQRYFREVDVDGLRSQFTPADPLAGIHFEALWHAFQRIIERAEQGEEIRTVEPDEIPIEVMVNDVLRRVILHPRGLRFSQLIRGTKRMEIIVSFLALLELLKSGKVHCEQSSQNEEIFVFPTEKAWEFTEGE